MPDLRWLALTDAPLSVHGLAWFAENGGEVYRLPKRLKGVVRDAVWSLATCPSGARVRFASDTTAISIRTDYDADELAKNTGRSSWGALALYADGIFWRKAMPEAPGLADFEFVSGLPRALRHFTIHLPAIYGPKSIAIGLDADARVLPPAPLAVAKPIVFYGTSITQGATVGHGGLAYQSILGRILAADFVNLGFAGNGLGEPEMARATAEIDASCFVLDFSQNSPSPDHLRAHYGPFIDCLRAAHPATPIVCVTPIFSSKELFTSTWAYDNPAMSEVIRQVVAERIARGDRCLLLIEGRMLLGPDDTDGLSDGLHPNEIGFRLMAERLAPALRTALSLNKAKP